MTHPSFHYSQTLWYIILITLLPFYSINAKTMVNYPSLNNPLGEDVYTWKLGVSMASNTSSDRHFQHLPQLENASVYKKTSYTNSDFQLLYGQHQDVNVEFSFQYQVQNIESLQQVDYAFSEFDKNIRSNIASTRSRLLFARFLNIENSETKPSVPIYTLLYGLTFPEIHGNNIESKSYKLLTGLGATFKHTDPTVQIELLPLIGYYPKLRKPYFYTEITGRKYFSKIILSLQLSYAYNRYIHKDKAYLEDLEDYLAVGGINNIIAEEITDNLITKFEKDAFDTMKKISFEISEPDTGKFNLYGRIEKTLANRHDPAKPVFTLGLWKKF